MSMLTELHIQNLGPIADASLRPSPGMTAITGETGAGKSMLLSAISMLAGGDVPADKVSPGADKATATGVFDYYGDAGNENNRPRPFEDADNASDGPHSLGNENNESDSQSLMEGTGGENDAAGKPEAIIKAENAGISVDGDEPELVVKRIAPSKGRGRCLVNGETVSRNVMRSIGGSLITLHGQSDQMRISSAGRQLAMLDAYADDKPELDAYADAYNARIALEDRLAKANDPEAADRAEYLKSAIGRISKADLHVGEYDELKQRIGDMEYNADRRDALMQALRALNGGDGDADMCPSGHAEDAVGALRTVAECLEATGVRQSDEWIAGIEGMVESLDGIAHGIMDAIDGIESFDLEAANERLLEISRVVKRHGGSEETALATLAKYQHELEGIVIDPDEIANLEAELREAKKTEDSKAKALTAKRRQAAKRLAGNVNSELPSLAMPGATFTVFIEPHEADRTGHDRIAFTLSAYKGAPELPLGKGASGGELSRVMLALELALASRNPDPDLTFVFDEVDANLGGAAGVEIGKRLAKLAESSQVIVVSHLAQVAAYAGTQYVVSKCEHADGHVETTIHEVNGDERIDEMARMLSGDESDISRAHAKELLNRRKSA